MIQPLYIRLICFLAACCIVNITSGQLKIVGPSCVTTETVYQYEVQGDFKEHDKLSICVKGGIFIETKASCFDTSAISTFRVHWNPDIKQGEIQIQSIEGATSLTVQVALPLTPGQIATTQKKQLVAFNKTPAALICSPAIGGNCDARYDYQWQKSSDKLKWSDIPTETGVNLSGNVPLKEALFFRRRVIEANSGTEAYSDEAVVFVTPQTNLIKQ